MDEPDITAEFAEWAKRNKLALPDEEEDEYDDLWELFIDEEYNDQRQYPEQYPA